METQPGRKFVREIAVLKVYSIVFILFYFGFYELSVAFFQKWFYNAVIIPERESYISFILKTG